MSARWCSACEESWPPGDALCPQCREPTALTRERPRRTKEEAADALARWEKRQALADARKRFESYYDDREQRRIAEGFVAPEHLGKLEARRTVEMVRASDELEKSL